MVHLVVQTMAWAQRWKQCLRRLAGVPQGDLLKPATTPPTRTSSVRFRLLIPRAAAVVQALIAQVASNPDSIPSRDVLYEVYQGHLARVLSKHPSYHGGVSMFDLLSFDAEFGEEVLRVFDSIVRYRASQELATMRQAQASTGCIVFLAFTAGVFGTATASAIALLV
jgi:hypothetical protein